MTIRILIFVNPLAHSVVKKFIQPMDILFLQYFRNWVVEFGRSDQLGNIHLLKLLRLYCLKCICIHNWSLIIEIIWRQVIILTGFLCFNFVLDCNWMSSCTVFVLYSRADVATTISLLIPVSKLEHAVSFLFMTFITGSLVEIYLKLFILFQLIFIFLRRPFWWS